MHLQYQPHNICKYISDRIETDSNPITHTTSGGGLKCIPDETGQVKMHLVVETTFVNFTPPKNGKK